MESPEQLEVDESGLLRIRGSVSERSLRRALDLASERYGAGNETRAWHVSPAVTRDRGLLDRFWRLGRFVDVDGELSILGLPVEVDPELPDGAFELREQLWD